MDSFIFSVNAVLPIILTVLVGYVLKKLGFMPKNFSTMANKLVFKVFLPSLLFINVYKINSIVGIDITYIVYALIAVVIGFFLMLPTVILITKRDRYRGALLQATFRSNFALVGIPLAQSLFGDEGIIAATLMSAAVIPAFNVLAVISLSIFSSDGKKIGFGSIIKNIIKNPLIQSIFIGLVCLVIRFYFIKYNIDFRLSNTPVFKVFENLSKLATPLALLVLGAQFEFSSVKELRKEIIFGTVIRTVVFPILCLGCAIIFFNQQFTGAHIAVFVAVFASPVAVSSVPMAQEMNSDSTLAGQLVVWTTIVSALTIFIYSFILKSIGIF